VSLLEEYDIPVYSLKEGIHEYDFEAEKAFFKHFENQDIPDGELKIHLLLHRKTGMMELEFHISGFLKVQCDRCLDEFQHMIDLDEKFYIRYGENEEEISENLIVITHDKSKINIAQYIYEFAVLHLPVQKIHPDKMNGSSGCNQQMIEKLNKHVNAPQKDKNDPRWDALKNLMN